MLQPTVKTPNYLIHLSGPMPVSQVFACTTAMRWSHAAEALKYLFTRAYSTHIPNGYSMSLVRRPMCHVRNGGRLHSRNQIYCRQNGGLEEGDGTLYKLKGKTSADSTSVTAAQTKKLTGRKSKCSFQARAADFWQPGTELQLKVSGCVA